MIRYRVLIPLLLAAATVWVTALAPNIAETYLDQSDSRSRNAPILELSGNMVNEVHNQLRRVQISDWVDEFSRMALEAHARGDGVLLSQASFEKPADLTGYRVRLEGLEQAPGTDIALAVVGVNRIAFQDLIPDFKPSMEMADLVVAGVRDGQEFCLAIHTDQPHPDPQVGRGLGFALQRADASYTLDPGFQRAALMQCYWVGKYGLPGEQVAMWLERGGYGLGVSTDPGTQRAVEQIISAQIERWSSVQRIALGTLNSPWEQEAGRRCRYDRDYCDHNWTLTDVQPRLQKAYAEGLAPIVIDGRTLTSDLANPGIDPVTFSALEEEFGLEAFKAFWTSELEPMAAFESAFGIDPRDWSHDRVVGVLGLTRAGPRPDNSAIFYGLVMGLLGVLSGALFGIRRTTG